MLTPSSLEITPSLLEIAPISLEIAPIDPQISQIEQIDRFPNCSEVERMGGSYCSLLTAHCLLLTAYCSLLTALLQNPVDRRQLLPGEGKVPRRAHTIINLAFPARADERAGHDRMA